MAHKAFSQDVNEFGGYAYTAQALSGRMSNARISKSILAMDVFTGKKIIDIGDFDEKILEIILSIENHTNTIIHMITHDKIPYVMEIFMILDDRVYLQIPEKSMNSIRKTRLNVSDKENGGLLGVLNQQV